MSHFIQALRESKVSGTTISEALERLVNQSPPDDDGERLTSHIEVVRTDAAKRQVFGWAYQTRTKEGEVIEDLKRGWTTTEVLEDAAYDFVLVQRNMGEMHQKEPGKDEYVVRGRLIESFMVTRQKCEALGIPEGTLPDGWWVGFYVDDDDTWARIERGELPDFSVAGIAESVYEEPAK